MGYSEVADLSCEKSVALGGSHKGKANPTKLEGYYIGTKNVKSLKSKTGLAALHIFKTATGNVGVWGKTDLDQKMLSVSPGVMTRISFVGMVETKNNPMYKYKVEVDQANLIDIASAIEESGDSEESSYSNGEESYEEAEEPEAYDEPAPARARPPVRAASVPSAEAQAKTRALLAGRNKAS